MADILTSFKPKLIDAISEKFKSPAAVAQLNKFQAELNDIIARIHACEVTNQTIAQNYSNLMNQLYSGASQQSLSALNMIATKETELDIQTQNLINLLFQKEHEILDYLTDGMATTVSYTIYYSDDLGNGEEVMRGTIDSKELYNSNALTITNQRIGLTRSKAAELFQTKGSTARLNSEQTQTYAKLVQTAITNMEDAFKQLQKELKNIKRKAQKEHLGEQLYKRYQRLQRLVGSDKKIEGLYGSYLLNTNLQMTNRRNSLWGAEYNRGHIYEALERFIQGSTENLTELLGESIGNDPWWTQGDVGSIQVKAMIGQYYNFSTKSFQDTSVQIASLQSIFEVAAFLQQILKERNLAMEQLPEQVRKKIEANDTGGPTNGSIENLIAYKTTRDLIKRFGKL